MFSSYIYKKIITLLFSLSADKVLYGALYGAILRNILLTAFDMMLQSQL